MVGFEQFRQEYRAKMQEAARSVPEIAALESLDALQDLTFVGYRERSHDLKFDGAVFEYNALAPTLFPFPRKTLIELGYCKPHQVMCAVGSQTKKTVYMRFEKGQLEIQLTVGKEHHPGKEFLNRL